MGGLMGFSWGVCPCLVWCVPLGLEDGKFDEIINQAHNHHIDMVSKPDV